MTTTTTTGQIHELGDRWLAAEIAADAATLATMATDDFRLVGPFGFVLDKAQWLDRYRSGDFVTTSLSWHDVDVRQYGDTVVTIGTQTQEAAYKGTPNNGDFRITHIFVRDGIGEGFVRDGMRDGIGDGSRWAIAGIHLSLTAPPPRPPQ